MPRRCHNCGQPVGVVVTPHKNSSSPLYVINPLCVINLPLGPQDVQVLWEEYKHRHDLVWKVVLQITTAVVILSVVPYLAPNTVVSYLWWWVLAAPALAFALGLFSTVVMNNELSLLGKIRTAHRRLQGSIFGVHHDIPQKGPDLFRRYVKVYLIVLVVLSLINGLVCAVWWLELGPILVGVWESISETS